ncbi:MAG: hypothetical protein RIR56_388 [Bacteroidota bacterium]|jgi:tRNA1Val (adenine37-N6)-methyltransferase
MKPFRFQQFSIQQSKDVFRVGTDGVLLGAMCNVKNAKKILEIGTGTGLISLMLAQRNVSAKILAIDINENAVKLASENFINSIFNENLKVELKDFKNFETNENFDLVVCNPPFFEENASAKDVLARQQVELNFRNLVEKSTEIITKKGILSIILPSEAAMDVKSLAAEFNLYLVREINIYGIEGGNLKRNILEFSLAQKPLEISDFVIEKSPREYSDQYLNLTKNFHVFGK